MGRRFLCEVILKKRLKVSEQKNHRDTGGRIFEAQGIESAKALGQEFM